MSEYSCNSNYTERPGLHGPLQGPSDDPEMFLRPVSELRSYDRVNGTTKKESRRGSYT